MQGRLPGIRTIIRDNVGDKADGRWLGRPAERTWLLNITIN